MDPGEVLLLHAEPAAGPSADAAALLAPVPDAAAWARAGRVYTLRDVAAAPGEPALALAVVLPLAAGGAHLRYVAVRPDRRGRGYARRLLESVTDQVRRDGARRLLATLPAGAAAAAALLHAEGFRTVPPEPGAGPSAAAGEGGWLELLL